MARRQLLLLLFMTAVPLALLAVLGWRLARDERAQIRQRFQEIFRQQLADTDGLIAGYFADRQREFSALATELPLDADRLRARQRREPRVQQIFILAADGRIMHPLPGTPLNDDERSFLLHFAPVVNDRDLVRLAAPPDDELQEAEQAQGPVKRAFGWYPFFWGRGVHLIFWQRRDSGEIVGILLERARWMADIIALLPETGLPGKYDGLAHDARIRLLDSNGDAVYQWGAYDPPETETAFAELPLQSPLSSWRLQYLIAESWLATAQPRSAYFNILAGLVAGGVALVLTAIVFYREYARELAEATQRVNFVNQVSHELKTPLTNIRMYADLLERDL